MPIILTYSTNASALCGNRLRAGELVAFPTETVYGLGADALNSAAVLKVFAAKGRPSTDPLIVHIADLSQAWPLVKMTPDEQRVFTVLANEFWPGPLTVVVPSSEKIPMEVTAGKNSVGIRIPANNIALELLRNAGVPVAAPSANRFGHISPTTAQHVHADLVHTDVTILDGGNCQVGIESTVVKICDAQNLLLLRRGAVLPDQILAALKSGGVKATLTEYRREEKSTAIVQDAPGQLLTHYSPSLPTFVFVGLHADFENSINANSVKKIELSETKKTVFIDFNKKFSSLKNEFFGYSDLSTIGNAKESASNLFDTMRWAESVNGAKMIFLPDLSSEKDPFLLAIFDRIYRAASGKRSTIIE